MTNKWQKGALVVIYNTPMSYYLAIECSTEHASVALQVGTQRIQQPLASGYGQSTGILPAIQQLLANAQINGSQIDGVLVGVGPGAFTGLRLAVGVAQGLCLGWDRPALPLTSLENLARQSLTDTAPPTHIASLLDARMGEFYAAHFVTDALIQHTHAPQYQLLNADGVAKWLASLPSHTRCVGAGWAIWHPTQAQTTTPLLADAPLFPTADALCRYAASAPSHAWLTHAADCQPIYVRNEVAHKKVIKNQHKTP